MTRYRIAVIPGDGIGQEVVPAGLHVLEAAAAKHGLRFEWDGLPWGCDYYRQHGRMMPQDALLQIRGHDAIYLGAEGSRHKAPSRSGPMGGGLVPSGIGG